MMPAGPGVGAGHTRASPGRAHLCGGGRPAPPLRWLSAPGETVSAPAAVGSDRPWVEAAQCQSCLWDLGREDGSEEVRSILGQAPVST